MNKKYCLIKKGDLSKNRGLTHLNKMTVTASVKFVFADRKSDVIDRFVKKYKDSHRIISVCNI